MPSLQQVSSKGSHGPPGKRTARTVSQSYLGVGGGDVWLSGVKGGELEASSSPPQMFLAFSSLVAV